MFRNYWITALRNLRRSASQTVINVAGLVLGLAGAINVYLITSYLLSYDGFHKDADRIYRVVNQSRISSGTEFSAGVPLPFTESFVSEFPEAEKVAFVSYKNYGLISVESDSGKVKTFDERRGITYVTKEFYQIIDRPWLAGDPHTALTAANSAVISRKSAMKYFNSLDVIGNSIRLDNQYDLKITGVMEDFPGNTHFPFDVIISYETVRKDYEREASWSNTSSDDQCYLVLKADADLTAVNKRLEAFSENYINADHTGRERLYFLQPLKELHFDTRFGNYLYVAVGWSSIITMIIIGAFLLITAIVNFINISTAMAVNRAKEVGIRKVIGGSRTQLLVQFLGETFMVTFLAMLISLGLMELVIVLYINPFLNIELMANLTKDVSLVSFLLTLLLVVSLLAGLYPALVLSGFQPVHAIKNNISSRIFGGFSLRKGLVVFQFIISQVFIIGTMTMYWQMDFLRRFDMGFNRTAIFTVSLPETNKAFAFQAMLQNNKGIESTSLSYRPPSSGSSSATVVKRIIDAENYTFQYKSIDTAFLSLYKIDLIAGKNIHPEDTFRSILVNETLVKHLGFERPSEAIGETFDYHGRMIQIQGVVKDFQTASLKRPVKPLFLRYDKENFYTLSIALKPGDWSETLTFVEKKWKELYPDRIYTGSFLDHQIDSFYQGEQKLALLISIFSGIAIFIGCLGMYGLVLFMSKVKTKEIGIRKVLGASVLSIVNMFSLEFTKLIIIAFLIAAPVAWFGMDKFLQNYTYHIDLGWKLFLSGIAVTFAIAFLTIGIQTVKSAIANPVDSLRAE